MARVYLDSCVVIYLREGTPEQKARIHEAMAKASAAGSTFNVSELVRFECRVGPLRRADLPLLADYDAFFALPELMVVPLERAAFDRAASLRVTMALKTPDALHVGAALTSGCDELWTNDRRFSVLEPTLRVVVVS